MTKILKRLLKRSAIAKLRSRSGSPIIFQMAIGIGLMLCLDHSVNWYLRRQVLTSSLQCVIDVIRTFFFPQADIVILIGQMSHIVGKIESLQAAICSHMILETAHGGPHFGIARVLCDLNLETSISSSTTKFKIESSAI